MYLNINLHMNEAMSTLAEFAPPLVAILPPHLKETNNWIFVKNEKNKQILELLYQELHEMSINTNGYNEIMDSNQWGLCLVDITSNFIRPCIADFKIGFIRHSPHTPKEKLERISKKRLVQPFALRLCGAHHFYNNNNNDYKEEYFDKDFGYSLNSKEEYRFCLESFFSSTISMKDINNKYLNYKDTEIVKSRLFACRQNVEKILNFFKSSIGQKLLENIAFVSTSLLLVYDADKNEDTEVNNFNNVRVYLIDYGRSSDRRLNFTEEKLGFICGLENMIHLLS